MRSIKPIPKHLLIHSIIYEERADGDGWNNEPVSDPITVNNVRVQPSRILSRTSNREEITADHVLFLDRVHSSHFFKMKEGATVKFNGDAWKVETVQTFYDFRQEPHHYEVGLV